MSPKVKFCRLKKIPANRHITREPEELQRSRKAHMIALLTLFRISALIFDLRSTVRPLENKTSKNNCSGFSVITFTSIKGRHLFCKHRVLLSKHFKLLFKLF